MGKFFFFFFLCSLSRQPDNHLITYWSCCQALHSSEVSSIWQCDSLVTSWLSGHMWPGIIERKETNPSSMSTLSHLVLVAEKATAPHSSTLAWRIPWMEEPGGLQSTGSLRVGHDWATSLSLFAFMHWRRKWQPTPVLLPGESQGRGSLVGCRLWGRTESDTTEAT